MLDQAEIVKSERVTRQSELGTTLPLPSVVAQEHHHEADLYRDKNEAAADGAEVVAGLRSGVLATIDACVKAAMARRKFQGDPDAVTNFLAPLVAAGVLSASEARMGLASPKWTMLYKIGDYAERLRHPELVRYFLETGSHGHTNLFQIAVLFDQTPVDQPDESRVQLLVDMLCKKQAKTRQDLLKITRELKQAKRHGSPDPIQELAFTGGQRFDLVVSTPRPFDLRRLNEDFTGPLPRCLRIGESVANDAIFIAATRLSDLPVIKDRLLPGCGFGDTSPRVFLVRSPNDAEITTAQVIIVAERGSGDRARLSEIAWLPDDEQIDPVTLAARVVPDARHRLNLFASGETTGCCSVVGEANWSQIDD